MREMGQSAWLNTLSLTVQGSEGKSQRERQGKAVRTGYYVSIFILFSRFKGEKWRQSGRIALLQDRRRRSEYLSIMQDAHKGCPARPQRVKGRKAYPLGAHGATNKEHHVCARRRVVRRLGPR